MGEESERAQQTGCEAEHPVVDYLRISVTDRCNLRCLYCMPEEGVQSLPHEEILSYEELVRFTRAAVENGISRVRLTGGEPLVRKGLVDFVSMLTDIEPAPRVSMTTNGVLLERYAAGLRGAGLERVNVSIDSLDPGVYRRVTRVGDLERSLAGLRKAIEVGLTPVKINVVVLKGINDDPTGFARLTMEMPVHVRFIEYMPYFGKHDKWFVPGKETRRRLEALGELQVVEAPEGWGPATSYLRLKGGMGTMGFIDPVSCHFCPACNRIRISSDGRMRTCLFDRDGVDIRKELRKGIDDVALGEIIEKELERKRREGDRKPAACDRLRVTDHMSRIGG